MKKVILTCLLVISLVCLAEAIQDIFSNQELSRLRKGDVVKGLYVEGSGYKRYPDLPDHLKLPAGSPFHAVAWEKAFFSLNERIKDTGKLFSGLVSVPGYTDIRYYSVTERKELPLIIRSEMISGARGKTGSEVNRFGFTDEIRLADNRLGDLFFSRIIKSDGHKLEISVKNSRPVYRYGIKLSEKGNYCQCYFFIYDHKRNGLYYYGIHAMRLTSPTFLNWGFNPASTGNRLRAMTAYFSTLCSGSSKVPLAAYVE